MEEKKRIQMNKDSCQTRNCIVNLSMHRFNANALHLSAYAFLARDFGNRFFDSLLFSIPFVNFQQITNKNISQFEYKTKRRRFIQCELL